MESAAQHSDQAIVVALGSNLKGEFDSTQALLEAAVQGLDEAGLKVVRRSRWWRSAAWPDPSDPPYLNGVVLIETQLGLKQTLIALHGIESRFGRDRHTPNAPRTLDLDLIAYGRETAAGGVTVPHPRAAERLFVMGPLAEVAPDWAHPVLGETAGVLAGRATVGVDATPIALASAARS